MMSINYYDKYLKYKTKYNNIKNQFGGSNYISPFKLYLGNGNKNITCSIHIQIKINPDSYVGKELHARRNKCIQSLENILGNNEFTINFKPHITLLEIFFNPETVLGNTIINSLINNDHVIINIISNAYDELLRNKFCHSPIDNYIMLGNFFTRQYQEPENYSDFKIKIYKELCNLVSNHINLSDLYRHLPLQLTNKNGKIITFHRFSGSEIDYIVSDYFYGNGWIPHLSLIKFSSNNTQMINETQEVFDEIKNVFKNSASLLSSSGNMITRALSYINLWSLNETKNGYTGSIYSIQVTLNHPDYEMYEYSDEKIL